MQYSKPGEVSREQFEGAIADGDVDTVIAGIHALAQTDPDTEWLQSRFIKLLDSDSWQVRAASAMGLGTLARVHPDLTADPMLTALRRHLGDPQIAGYVEDAIDDITVFSRDSDSSR